MQVLKIRPAAVGKKPMNQKNKVALLSFKTIIAMNTINKIIQSAFSAIVVILFMTSCTEENNYNYDEIEPRLINGISGEKEVTATGFTKYNYSVIHRGGSNYNWSINNEDMVLSIEKNKDYPNQASIIFAELHDTSKINITVKEITEGGKTASATDTVQLMPFCPYQAEKYTGEWVSSDTMSVADTVLTETIEKPNQLRVYGLADFINTRWGEKWINGDGSCILELNCNEKVEIKRQWLGDTDYPDRYEILGAGTIDTTSNTLQLSYDIFYSNGTGSKHISTVLSME